MIVSVQRLLLGVMFAMTTTAPADAQRNRVEWPKVNDDRTITFRLEAPEANSVAVDAAFADDAKPMTKDTEGVWNATLGPVEPDIWLYSFIVDGVQMIDPHHNHVQWSLELVESLVEVPGKEIEFCMVQDVPHGIVHTYRYQSKSTGSTREYLVYTPPGYGDDQDKNYPVLYLLHGSGDTEKSWTMIGRADTIADNLLATGGMQPMLIVMPFGHVLELDRPQSQEAFEKDLLNDVIPDVQSNYRVIKDKQNRAIMGLSMGGGQSFHIGLAHQDMFSWIGLFSASVRNANEFAETHPDQIKSLNENLNLLWVGIGKRDSLWERNVELRAMLDKHGVKYVSKLTDGTHEYNEWRRYLHETLPLLFVKRAD